jgi:hypothetical protein
LASSPRPVILRVKKGSSSQLTMRMSSSPLSGVCPSSSFGIAVYDLSHSLHSSTRRSGRWLLSFGLAG